MLTTPKEQELDDPTISPLTPKDQELDDPTISPLTPKEQEVDDPTIIPLTPKEQELDDTTIIPLVITAELEDVNLHDSTPESTLDREQRASSVTSTTSDHQTSDSLTTPQDEEDAMKQKDRRLSELSRSSDEDSFRVKVEPYGASPASTVTRTPPTTL